MDSSPGAWTIIDGIEVKLYQSTIWTDEMPSGNQVNIDSLQIPAIVHDNGLLITCNNGLKVNNILLIITSILMFDFVKYQIDLILCQITINYDC